MFNIPDMLVREPTFRAVNRIVRPRDRLFTQWLWQCGRVACVIRVVVP